MAAPAARAARGAFLPFLRAAHQRGFTLLELLVVVAIVALASVGAVLALRDSDSGVLLREGERLAALLEAARAQSRASGSTVRWVAEEQSFHFEGLPPKVQLATQWLDADTGVAAPSVLWLGPDPVIGAQQVALVNARVPGQALRVASDGLRPFAVETAP